MTLLLAALALAACSSGGAASSANPTAVPTASIAQPTHAPMATEAPMASLEPMTSPAPKTTGAPMISNEPIATAAPVASDYPTPSPAGAVFEQAWATATLTDVATGEQFRIADIAAEGKVVFVETMAMWCPKCLAQQRQAAAAFESIDPANAQLVVLDVEPTESAADLARYREQNDFPFRYAIADTDVARALARDFGDTVLSPPSINVIVLAADGTISHTTGGHTADELISLAEDAGA